MVQKYAPAKHWSNGITTFYLGKAFEYVIDASGAGTTTRQKHYVGNYMVYTQESGAINNNEYRFLLDDHLGSVDAITDVNGYVIERKGYDVFGNTRTGNWRNDWSGPFAVTDRGFTQHETLTDVGLIHMNGRAYDPSLGRFLSVDPAIQSPSFSQSLNGYAYVMNNPLSSTDPTGYRAVNKAAKGPLTRPRSITRNRYRSGAANRGPDTSQYGGAMYKNAGVGLNTKHNFNNDESKARMKRISELGAQPEDLSDPGAALGKATEENQIGIYKFAKNTDGIWEYAGHTSSVETDTAFVNGINNSLEYAGQLGVAHVTAAFGDVDEFSVFYNPTQSIGRDSLEAIADKSGIYSGVAKDLAGVLAQTQAEGRDVSWVAHSQGGAIFSSAVRYHNQRNAEGSLDGMRVAFHSGANNRRSTRINLARAGIENQGFRDHRHDAVPQILGGNTLNPFRILGSMIRLPDSFRGPERSTHTLPCAECSYEQ